MGYLISRLSHDAIRLLIARGDSTTF